jgi:hypothetical protein
MKTMNFMGDGLRWTGVEEAGREARPAAREGACAPHEMISAGYPGGPQ